MDTESQAGREARRSGVSRMFLFLGAGAVIGVTYLFSLVSIVVLGVLIALEFLVFLGLLRFGLSGLVAGVLGAHIKVVSIFLRSLWLSKGLELRVSLGVEDAPKLFALVEDLCLRARVARPREIHVEMNVTAWVRLDGYRRGGGRTVLGLGYDLLAGLTQREIEAVIAHELTHAKLVRRGVKKWLNGGLRRISQLTGALWEQAEAARRAKRSGGFARAFMNLSDRLTRWAARFVAACSRQDEFDADAGAAELCGAGALRSALMKLERLDRRSSRLPWNERVARLQSGQGFGRWLIGELNSAENDAVVVSSGRLFYQYSTHPSLEDRLEALPEATGGEAGGEPGEALGLLTDPDKVAESLISEIQRVLGLQERKDSRQLRKWTRKAGSRSHVRPLQLLGALLVIAAPSYAFIRWALEGFLLVDVLIALVALVLGVMCYRWGRYRDRLTLSIPPYGVIKAGWESDREATPEGVKRMESELRASVAEERSKRKRTLALAEASYRALGRCDYVAAHVAAGLCLQLNNKSVEGAVGFAVASAALNQSAQMQQAVAFLQQRVGIRGGTVAWAVGWACVLLGDWTGGEGALELVRAEQPWHPTILSLLALCQHRRGKLQSALESAREACDSPQATQENTKLLIDLLLEFGYLREARERLEKLRGAVKGDPELLLSKVRLHLLSGQLEEAEEAALLFRQHADAHPLLVRLGELYEVARQMPTAAGLYHEALAAGHHPRALLGLARIAADRGETERARAQILRALDFTKPAGRRAAGPLALFPQIVGQLLELEEPVPRCRAWVVRMAGTGVPEEVANVSFLVYGLDRSEAERALAMMLAAMRPGEPPPLGAASWQDAPKEQQPDGPVRPGVQGVVT